MVSRITRTALVDATERERECATFFPGPVRRAVLRAEDLTPEQLRTLAREHVTHYQMRLCGADGAVPLEQCERYLRLWEEIASLSSAAELAPWQRVEVQDALDARYWDTTFL